MADKLPIACDLTVFSPAEREQHTALAARIAAEATTVDEIARGFVLRFADRPGFVRDLAAFVEDDRRCCAFVTFTICVDPTTGVALTVDGSLESKAALLAIYAVSR